MSTRSLSRIPFDPREERVIAGLARWMGRLGRFQIVAAGFVFILLLAATGVVSMVELIEPATATAGDTPLISIGDVPRFAIAGTIAAVVVLSLVVLRGGMLLLSAAEDLESVVTTDELDQHHLEGALRRLKSYFVLESCLMLVGAAATYAATISGWGG